MMQWQEVAVGLGILVGVVGGVFFVGWLSLNIEVWWKRGKGTTQPYSLREDHAETWAAGLTISLALIVLVLACWGLGTVYYELTDGIAMSAKGER